MTPDRMSTEMLHLLRCAEALGKLEAWLRAHPMDDADVGIDRKTSGDPMEVRCELDGHYGWSSDLPSAILAAVEKAGGA